MKTLVILNHDLTADQIADLGGDITTLSPEQKKIWGQIPATGSKWDVQKHIWPIAELVKDHDRVVVQGEFTAFVEILDLARLLNKPVLVACSQRETEEQVQTDGSTKKVTVFRHIQFREV